MLSPCSFVYFVSVLILCARPSLFFEDVPKVAIIGGGIGGTSTAYFLRQLFGAGKVHVDIYEAERVGGRLATVNVGGRSYETGGSIIHSRNKYMVSFVKKFDLKHRETRRGSRMGLWDGSQFVFEESPWEILTFFKMLWRYGFGIMKLRSYIDDMLTKFESIYHLQNKGEAYWTVSDMLKAMNPEFERDQRVHTRQGFQKLGISDVIVDEIIAATLRVNYGQDTSIHKFVGSVSVAGAIGDLWSVDGGNFRVAEMLLDNSEAQLVRDRVIKVSPVQDGKLVIKRLGASADGDNSELSRLYDIVVLAAPLYNNSEPTIDILDFPDKGWAGQYHRTVSTVLQGKLNHSFFGYSHAKDVPDEIIATEGGLLFNSVSQIYPVDFSHSDKKSDIWKVFSPKPLTEHDFSLLFSSYNKNSVRVNDWLAYPHYAQIPKSDLFRIHRNFYYLNAVEWAASAMEMSVIAARNVALLAYKNFNGEPVRTARHLPPVRGLEGGSYDEL